MKGQLDTRSRSACGRITQAVAALSLLTVAAPAWAYLDPGTGSMIISAIVGLFATLGLALKTYWYKIKAFFRKDASPTSSAAAEPSSDLAAEPERSTEN